VVRRRDSRMARAVLRLRAQRRWEEGNQETVVSESIWIVVNKRTISMWLDAAGIGVCCRVEAGALLFDVRRAAGDFSQAGKGGAQVDIRGRES
jgi:hypothetical protein